MERSKEDAKKFGKKAHSDIWEPEKIATSKK